MKAYSLIFGYFAINMAIWTVSTAGILSTYSYEAIVSPSGFEALFSLNVFTVVTGIVGGGVITIMTLITKSYALGTGVLILWLVGVILKPVNDLVIGLPRLIEGILPSEVWFISEVVVAFAALILFIFIVEVIAGRQIT